jgi:hypothetical protein
MIVSAIFLAACSFPTSDKKSKGIIMNQVRKILDRATDKYLEIEERFSVSGIVSVVDSLPAEFITKGIKSYQNVIRQNSWFFPRIVDVEVESFLTRWEKVHDYYFDTAIEVFEALRSPGGLDSISQPALLERVIASETMRGWVGKRSPSGLDALIRKQEGLIENLASQLMKPDDVELLFSFLGIYRDDPCMTTAESELVQLFNCDAFKAEVANGEVNFDSLEANSPTRKLLRSYCRYSRIEYEKKKTQLSGLTQGGGSPSGDSDGYQNALHLMGTLMSNHQMKLQKNFESLRALNFVNLALEVKFSFKGWAGLMHLAVFAASRQKANSTIDVYQTLSTLRENKI